MRQLGNLIAPELYSPAGKEVRVSNSIEALSFFENKYSKGGIVLLGNILFESAAIPSMMVWMYFTDIEGSKPKLVSTIPVFNVPMNKLNNLKILDITPFQTEVFSLWKDTLYSSVFTTTGEIRIMKVRMLLNSINAKQVIELQSGDVVESIYPVELYSRSQHKFIGVCWAVEMKSNQKFTYWHPVCLAEEKAIARYPVEDITDYFININETAVIQGETYRLLGDGINYFFKKEDRTKKKLRLINNFPKRIYLS